MDVCPSFGCLGYLNVRAVVLAMPHLILLDNCCHLDIYVDLYSDIYPHRLSDRIRHASHLIYCNNRFAFIKCKNRIA